jgi:hypothetical protein
MKLSIRGLLISVIAFVCISCRSLPPQSTDYTFAVSGTVLAEDGQPVVAATVALKIQGTVYDAITPISVAEKTTDAMGRFQFMYLAHETKVAYSLTVSKEGYREETVAGTTPPPSVHSIQLRK